MTICYDVGVLRAYLDEELGAPEMAAVTTHLTDCTTCRARLAEVDVLDRRIRASFPMPRPAEQADRAWSKLQPQLAQLARTPSLRSRRLPGGSLRPATRRPLAIGAIAAGLLLTILLVPQARAAAAQFLQIFRAESVIYVSVSLARIQQLESLQTSEGALFVAKPALVGAPPTQQDVASPAQASALAGFAVQAPTAFASPPTATTYTVQGSSTYQLQVNVKTLRDVLGALGVTDVTIPDSLGAQPITVKLSPIVQAQYQGKNYTLTLVEGTSPTVALPPDVNLAQMGKALLEVYGMDPQHADTMSKQIDWKSTLVFPFPLATTRLEQVRIGDAQGVLLNASQNGSRGYLLYWQNGSRFYILKGTGDAMDNAGMVSAAASVR